MNNNNSAEVDIALALVEIITACNVGQEKPGHGSCMKSMLRTYTMQGFILTAIENCTLVADSTNILTKLMEREMKVKDTGTWFMHEEYVKDNYYAMLHTHSFHCCSEMHFSSRLEVILTSQWSVKCRLRVLGHGACSKGVSR